MPLSNYSKEDLKKIVEIYNLSIDEKSLKKKKGDLIKEMNKKGKGQLEDYDEINKKLKKHDDTKTKKTKAKKKKPLKDDPKQPKIKDIYKTKKK